MQERELPVGIGRLLWANRRRRSLPSQYPTLGQSDPDPPRMPSCRLCTADWATATTVIITCGHCNTGATQLSNMVDQSTDLRNRLISSHLLVSSGPEARLLHPRPGQARPGRHPPDASFTFLGWGRGALVHGARDVAWTFVASSGNLVLAHPGPQCVAAIPLLVSATAPCPSSITPGPPRVLATTVTRPSPAQGLSPQKRLDTAHHVRPDPDRPPSLADFVFVQSSIRPTLFSSDVTGNPSG